MDGCRGFRAIIELFMAAAKAASVWVDIWARLSESKCNAMKSGGAP